MGGITPERVRTSGEAIAKIVLVGHAVDSDLGRRQLRQRYSVVAFAP
jgi:hypothetical protein